jgi:hypothetical protein
LENRETEYFGEFFWIKYIMSYVYFILDNTSGAIKIGKANDIDERISGLQTGNPNELIVLHYVKCESVEGAFNLEKYCHDKFNHLHVRGEWFKYDKEIFQSFFIEETTFKTKPKRKPLVRNTLWGEEIVFDVDTHPRCYFYDWHVAQIYDSYEKASRLTIPFRTMKWPTYGKCLLLPFSDKKNRVFISNKKHEQNREYNKFKKETELYE